LLDLDLVVADLDLLRWGQGPDRVLFLRRPVPFGMAILRAAEWERVNRPVYAAQMPICAPLALRPMVICVAGPAKPAVVRGLAAIAVPPLWFARKASAFGGESAAATAVALRRACPGIAVTHALAPARLVPAQRRVLSARRTRPAAIRWYLVKARARPIVPAAVTLAHTGTEIRLSFRPIVTPN
jgi:hypothetical protein